MKRSRRSEATQAREKVSELAEARKEAINLEVEQLREQHSVQMGLLKLNTENKKLKKEALK